LSCCTQRRLIFVRVRFSPDQEALFVDYADLKENFSFYDNSGLSYSLPFTPNIVEPQWGNE